LLSGLAYAYPGPQELEGVSHDLLTEIIRRCQLGPIYRTDLRFLFSKARRSADDPAQQGEIDWLEAYIEQAWERSVAINCDCSYGYEPDTDARYPSRFTKLIAEMADDDEFLPGGVFRHLGVFPTAKYQAFATLMQDDLQQWWQSATGMPCGA
jgi:hypothetical protein